MWVPTGEDWMNPATQAVGLFSSACSYIDGDRGQETNALGEVSS